MPTHFRTVGPRTLPISGEPSYADGKYLYLMARSLPKRPSIFGSACTAPNMSNRYGGRHLRGHSQTKDERPSVAERLEHIYQARNRLAHHEPVLHKRFRETISAIEFVSENLSIAIPSNDTPLAKLIADELRLVKGKATVLHDRLDSFRNS